MPTPLATSGTTTFIETRNQIIFASLRKIGAIESGETPGAQMITDAALALNGIVKEWQATGIHVWTEQDLTLFLQPGQNQYSLGAGSSDHFAQNWVQATLTADALITATVVALTSVSGIASTNNIGIILDAGNIFWTTVSGAPSGLNVTLAAPLPSQASSGAIAIVYATSFVRPLRIPAARRFNLPSLIENPLVGMSRLDYFNMPDKTNLGSINQFYYSPQIGQNGGQYNPGTPVGQFYVWPTPASPIVDCVKFTGLMPLQDFTNASQVGDFPQEWMSTLIYQLAVEIAPEYGVNQTDYALLLGRANEKLDRLMSWDREPESVYFGVSYDPTSRV